MLNLTPEDQQRLQAELTAGEQVLWTGKPNTAVIFHSTDWSLFGSSLVWVIVTAFGMRTALGSSHSLSEVKLNSAEFWLIPFIVMGQYLLWGRFVYAHWKKKQILYAVTSSRTISLLSYRTRKVVETCIDSLTSIERRIHPDGIGTIIFGQFPDTRTGSSYASGRNADPLYLSAGIPVFADIDDAQTVYALVTDLRARAHRSS